MFEKVAGIWSEASDAYDRTIQCQLKNQKTVESWKTILAKTVGENQELRVMDAGCGPGFFSILLRQMGYAVRSVDGAPGMVERTKANLRTAGGADVHLEDLVELPEEQPETYDAIVSRDVVWTLYDPERALKRWDEILKPGGRLVIFDGNYNYEQKTLGRTLWKFFGCALILVTEHRVRRKKDGDDTLENLPFCKVKRPDADQKLLTQMGYRILYCGKDPIRTHGLDHMKYGWQSSPFLIVAQKPGNRDGK